MTLAYLIDTYGYAAVLLGTMLEGETILVLGGIASKLGYLELPWVILCAFTGTLLGDQLAFFIGHYHGTSLLRKHPAWRGRADKAGRIVHRYGIMIIFGFRFLYGLRVVTPFVIGMSQYPIVKFVVLNAISAALWATGVGLLGYAFGHGLELILGNIRHYEMEIVLLVLVIGITIWLIHFLYIKRQQRSGR